MLNNISGTNRYEVTGTGCWEWKGAKDHGYGVVMVEGRKQYVHRLSYQLFRGEIFRTYEIDHLCRNPSCFNPDHLESVTSRENSIRGNHPLFVVRRTGICRRGLHPMVGDNVMVRANGTHRCRECARSRVRESRDRKKGESSKD